MTEDAKAEKRRARALVQRGLMLYARGELLAAASEWEMALDLDPTFEDARRYLDYLNENFDLLEERFRLAEDGEAVELSLPYELSAALDSARTRAADMALPTLEFPSLSQALLQDTGVRAVTMPYPVVDQDGWPLGDGAPSLGLGIGLVDEEAPAEEPVAPTVLPEELPAAPLPEDMPMGLGSAELALPSDEDIGAVFADEDEGFALGGLDRDSLDDDDEDDEDEDEDADTGDGGPHGVHGSDGGPLRARLARPERVVPMEEEDTVDMGSVPPSRLLWPSRKADWPSADAGQEPEAAQAASADSEASLGELSELGSLGDLDDLGPVPTTSPPGKLPVSLLIEELPPGSHAVPEPMPEPESDSGSLSAAFRRAALVDLGNAPTMPLPRMMAETAKGLPLPRMMAETPEGSPPRVTETLDGLPPPPLPAPASARRPVARKGGAPGIDEMARELISEAETQPIDSNKSPEQQLEQRVSRYIELAITAHGRGELARAVVATEVAINLEPDSAITQMQIQKHRDALCAIYLDYLGDPEAVPMMAVDMREIAVHQLDSRAMFLLSRLDGIMSISELLDIAGMPEHEALHYLASMRLRGVIKL